MSFADQDSQQSSLGHVDKTQPQYDTCLGRKPYDLLWNTATQSCEELSQIHFSFAMLVPVRHQLQENWHIMDAHITWNKSLIFTDQELYPEREKGMVSEKAAIKVLAGAVFVLRLNWRLDPTSSTFYIYIHLHQMCMMEAFSSFKTHVKNHLLHEPSQVPELGCLSTSFVLP
ncbi:uncharacterized protein LOC144308958 [Canis aureus]